MGAKIMILSKIHTSIQPSMQTKNILSENIMQIVPYVLGLAHCNTVCKYTCGNLFTLS